METASQEKITGTDGTSEMGDLQELDRVRRRCVNRVASIISSAPHVMTKADERAYRDEVFSDKALIRDGFTTVRDRIKALQQNLDVYLPQMQTQAPLLEKKFRGKIDEAISKKWIGRRSATRWMSRLSAENALFYQKKVFINEKFPVFLKNWQEVAEKRENLLKHPQLKMLKGKDVPKLGIFKNDDDFLNKSYDERKNIVSMVEAALSAKAREMPLLFSQARSQLEGAARKKALSWSKIGPWMEKIFKSGAKAETIDDFLNNKGNMPLSKLIANWTEASQRFESLEEKRKKKGTPRGFHFVKMEVFLNWHFERRKAYLDHAEESIEGIGNESDTILKIRHELGAEDWDSARQLILEAKQQPMTEQQSKRLGSMEKYLRENSNLAVAAPEEKTALRDPLVITKEINAIISESVPAPMQKFYKQTMSKGYQCFWAWTTLLYNRVWCHQHHFLSDDKERHLERTSHDKTRDRMKEGHSKYGTEANVVKGDTNAEEAIRDQDSGTKGAQFLMVKEEAHEILADKINEQKHNRNFWYWTSVIPEGLKYPEHLYIVQNINPRLKKLMRELEASGGRYSISGAAPAIAHKEVKPAPKKPVPQFSLN